jgi:hypothetical protein
VAQQADSSRQEAAAVAKDRAKKPSDLAELADLADVLADFQQDHPELSRVEAVKLFREAGADPES